MCVSNTNCFPHTVDVFDSIRGFFVNSTSLKNQHSHACTRTYIPCTHTLTRLLEKGVRIWEGMVLVCIRPYQATSIHRGTLAYIRWGIRLRGERPGEGDKVVGMQLHVYIHRAMCMCVW